MALPTTGHVWLEAHPSGGFVVFATDQDCLTVSPVPWDVAVGIARDFSLRTGASCDIDPIVRVVGGERP